MHVAAGEAGGGERGEYVSDFDVGARGAGLVLAGNGKFILGGAADLVTFRDIFGGNAHVIAVEGIPKPVLDHRVDKLDGAHLGAAAHRLRMGRQAHRLLAAGDHDPGIARLDGLRRQRDGTQPRTTDLVDAPRRTFLRNAGEHRCLARRVLALTGCQHLPEDDFVDLIGRNAGIGHCGDHRRFAEFMRRHAAECPHETAHGGAAGGGDYSSGHGQPFRRTMRFVARQR